MARLPDLAGLRTQLAIAISMGGGVGVAEALLLGTGETGASLAVTAVVGGGLVAGAGAILGVVQAVVLFAWRLLSRASGIGAWWERATTDDVDAPREPVVNLHASALGASVGLLVFAAVVWVVTPRLLALDDPEFAQSFAVVALGLGLVGATGGGFVLARLAVRPLLRLDARVALPWPRSAVTRYGLYLLLPVMAALVPFVLRNRTELGSFQRGFWLLVFIVAEGGGVLAWRALPWSKRLGRAALVAIVGGVVLTASAAVLIARNPAAEAWTRTTTAADAGAALLRDLSDVDFDGYSGLFGGGDCSAFDASVHPGARELPDNGVDEDCDGTDAQAVTTAKFAVMSGALEPDGIKHYDVVLVVVDAVRADFTGVGGYDQNSTPYIDAIGRGSFVFTNAWSQSSATQLSFPSILTGVDPAALMWQEAKRIHMAPGQPTLTRILRDAGYMTAVVSVNYFEDHLKNLQDEYEWVENPHRRKLPKTGWFRGLAAANVVEAIKFFEGPGAGDRPNFLTVYITDPHHPYSKHSFGISEFEDKDKNKALYAGEIAHTDRQIGFLAEYLMHSGRWDNTIFIVTSDHGEEFKEHGGTKHATTCYIESIAVPLVVHIPGLKPKKVDDPVALLDIMPTVLEAVGIDADELTLSGQSLLVPALAPSLRPEPRYITSTVFSQLAKQGNFFRRSVRTRELTLIHNIVEGSYELYDRAADPKEKRNLYDKRQDDPEVAQMRAHLSATLTGNLAEHIKKH